MTLRSIVIGLCLSVAVNLLASTVRWVYHGSYLAYSHLPMANLILCLLAIVGCALLARTFGSRFALTPTEWITIFCMGFISALGPTYGSSGYIVQMMVAPYYFATPENEWSRYLHPHLPDWLFPSNEGNAMAWFFEGLPQGAHTPWGVWLLPLVWVLLFACAAALALACLSILIHRQWSENEKLVFPAMIPVLEMTMRAGTGRRVLPEFMQGRAFWAGFGLTSFVFGWNMVVWFYPYFPRFPTASGRWMFFADHFPPIFLFLNTTILCFSYFASLEVLFSIWFFDLVFVVEGGFLNRIGVEAISPYYGTGRYIWQTTGGFVGLMLWWLWISREHLRNVFRRALRPGPSEADDGEGLLSYRSASLAMAISILYMIVWLVRAGMEGKMIATLLAVSFLVYLGLAKIMAYSGLVYLNAPTPPWNLSVAMLGGAGNLMPDTHAAYGASLFALNNYRGYVATTVAHINRLGEFVRIGKRRLFAGICIAFVAGVVVSSLYTIWLGYRIGAYQFRPNWLIVNGGLWHCRHIVQAVKDPAEVDPADYWFFAAGAGVVALLSLLRYRFVWWPFHPVGFALSSTWQPRTMTITVFVAWLVKLAMLRLAGASFYRRSRPFFIGMLVGYITAVGAGVIVDTIWFPEQSHIVHTWY